MNKYQERRAQKKNPQNISSKRGQIEVFGLAFIVVLISIGFFIFVSFKSQQEPVSPQKEFTNDKLANDFVLSLLDVSIAECRQFSVKDLIVDCARDKRILCNGEESCRVLNRSITIMLNKTFMARNTKFLFYSENLYNNGKELINITYLNCTRTLDSQRGQTGVAIISLYPAPGNVYLNMNICKQ